MSSLATMTLKLIGICLLCCLPLQAVAKQCLFLASYHKGYEWQDGIEEGVRSVLKDECNIEYYYMDTKRNTGEAYATQAAEQARKLISSMQPDVVIAVDDNASRYVIKPYFKDAKTPFVFCGVNWSADKYGFPYDNVTGMVEIISIAPLLKTVSTLLPVASSGIFIGGDVPSTRSNFERYKKAYSKKGINIKDGMVSNFDDWKEIYKKANENEDFIILANKAGIDNWDNDQATAHVLEHLKLLSVGHHEFMVNLNSFSMTKVPQEQGEWAGKLAKEILSGTKPSEIPIVPNRRWNIYANPQLLEQADIRLPSTLQRKSVEVKP